MALLEKQQPSLLLSLPPELILSTLAHIDYTPGHVGQLRHVCRALQSLLAHHEQSLATDIMRLHFPVKVLARYPGLHTPGASLGFKTLDEISIRLHTLSRVERNCYSIQRRQGKEAAWMRSEWINVQQAGLHLLYRLSDAANHKTQSEIIASLPTTSLAILLFTLHLCIHQLRSDGPSILQATSPLLHGMLRFEVELCCQELLLHHGPHFLDSLLCHSPPAIKLLQAEIRGMRDRQLPFDGHGKPRPKTLIAELRCAMAACMGTDVGENCRDMWAVLGAIGSLSDEDTIRVVAGEALVTARKRQDSAVAL